jgi:hypothetical protein
MSGKYDERHQRQQQKSHKIKSNLLENGFIKQNWWFCGKRKTKNKDLKTISNKVYAVIFCCCSSIYQKP